MFGVVTVLIAKEVQGEKTIQVFRELPYSRHILDEFTEESLDEIAGYLRTLLHRTSIEAVQGNVQGLSMILLSIKNIYLSVTKSLSRMQEFMPRSLIRFYEKIAHLQLQLAKNRINYIYNANTIAEIDEMENYMENVREQILSFWEDRPDIYIRLPIHLHRKSKLFFDEKYLPYIMGDVELPRWIDPMIIERMNVVRKFHQTREQTNVQQEKYTKYLTLMTRTISGISSEIVSMIVDYMPITVVFDLLESMTPSQFLKITDCEKIQSGQNCISIYVS
uniref:Uncharacterized protein n=1 Tax=viral metagenome TaxID=1070528 RepID=A0A6C0HUB6_9ZZZZ